MHSSWLYHIQFTVSTYSIQTYKYINKQDGIHCTHSNGTMKTEKKKLHGGRQHACHDTYQGNKYSFSVGELGLRNMYTK